jgi:CRP-like cAMP-binding protein
MSSLTDTVLASPLGRELTPPEAEVVASIVSVRDLKDGEVLLPEGARDEHDGGWNVLYHLQAGDLVGELSFMDDAPRYATLLAAGATRVLVLNRSDFETLIERQPRVVYKVMRGIMRVAHEVQRRLSRQMNELQQYLYRPGAKY